ncbi:YuzD family protein [Halalkalibacter urbisdiaboli]|uniref:YuzD family protein n=1 Tax=Halalkalibacter urbisdiaboli TaxID=1960589 RepID=UPI000B434C2D|nr:YuzD family protein [Halalkalibacter urbisdiaboli]
MKKPTVELVVFGAENKCASCVHLPSAFETKEWLEAALTRKYPEKIFHIRYVDIEEQVGEKDRQYAEAILNDEYFYPLVVLGGEVVAEGNPNLKTIYQKIEECP